MICQTDYCYTTYIQLECDIIHNQLIHTMHPHTHADTYLDPSRQLNQHSFFCGPTFFDMSLTISLISSSSSSVTSSAEATVPADVVVSVDVVCIFARTFFFAFSHWSSLSLSCPLSCFTACNTSTLTNNISTFMYCIHLFLFFGFAPTFRWCWCCHMVFRGKTWCR